MPSDDSFRSLTDEQLVWLFVNQIIDNEENLEKMCDKCKDEVTSNDKCIRCGKPHNNDTDRFVNPNFDESRFQELSDGTDDDGIDMDLVDEIMGVDMDGD